MHVCFPIYWSYVLIQLKERPVVGSTFYQVAEDDRISILQELCLERVLIPGVFKYLRCVKYKLFCPE